MSGHEIKAKFSKYNLGDSFEHVTRASPYTLVTLEKYTSEVGHLLDAGLWLGPLDYTDYQYKASHLLQKLNDATSDTECKSLIRRFRNIHSTRILWHDLAGLADWRTVFKAQSDLADICIKAVLDYLQREFATKYYASEYPDGSEMQLSVVAMGKWGGQELNFSSDIDFVLVYGAGVEIKGHEGRRDIDSHLYFTKIAQRLIQILDDMTPDGFAYRCDTRLRPFGNSGALVLSIAAMEQYLTQHGREWERYAYLKARCVTGDSTVKKDIEELRRPFVYRRYLDFGVFAKLRDMHAQIAEQVQKKELEDNLKLGRGGIRECEFLVQALQLLRGGRKKSLQQANFYLAHQSLQQEEVWNDIDNGLLNAYIYLRLLENRLQALHQQQTHQLPDKEDDRNSLCVAMQAPDWSTLLSELDNHRSTVSTLFNEQLSLFNIDSDSSGSDNRPWQELFQGTPGFSDEIKRQFVNLEKSRQYKNQTETSQQTLGKLIKAYLSEVLERQEKQSYAIAENDFSALNFLAVVNAIGKRTVYYALLVERPAALKHLIDVCYSSNYLCQQIAQRPILLDELLDVRIFSQAPKLEDLQQATRALVANSRDDQTEQFINDLVVHKHVQSFRIASAEIFKQLPLMKVSDRLSDLAELILEAVFVRVLQETVSKFNLPDMSPHESGFSIVAYGKLGGLELSYTSDLDIVFLYDENELEEQHPLRQDRSLLNNFYTRLVQQCLRYLNIPTSMGRLYEIDTRLRPSGNSGFLISSLDAFQTYQMEDAWVWEHQALTRARMVFGSDLLCEKFNQVRLKILSTAIDLPRLKNEVISMRNRMYEQYRKENAWIRQFHIKHSQGGMIDLEFLVQFLVLKNVGQVPELVQFSDNIRQLEALAKAGILDEVNADLLIQAYIRFREQVHLLSLQAKKPLLDDNKLKTERVLVQQLWMKFMG